MSQKATVSFNRFEDPEHVKWARRIKELDRFTCQVCRRRNVPFHSHHMNAWNAYPAERYDLNNGVCLCQLCHSALHLIYGKGDNTKAQFDEFLILAQAILSSLRKDGYNKS